MNRLFNLPAEFTIYNAQSTRDSLLAWIDKYGAKAKDQLQVCAQQVKEVDAAGLQLLASLSQTELASRWQLINPSAAFQQACDALGFTQWTQALAATPQASSASKKRKVNA